MSSRTTEARAGQAGASNRDVTPLPPLPAHWRSLARVFVHQAKAHPNRPAMDDSTKVKLSYGEAFLRACVLARALKRTLGPAKYVGLLLPPTAASSIANIAVSLLGKIPVNLNYTASQKIVDSSIDQCGITHVLASQKVLDRFGIVPKGTVLFLEDVAKQVTLADKLWGAAVAKAVPVGMLGLFLPGLNGDNLDQTATVIFTSGSTGDPKGVVLSNRNVLTNIHQINCHLNILPDEVILGVLPFFHAFGFTVTIWTVLCLGKRVVYHYNPLDAHVVGKLCEQFGVTMITCSPTFMTAYLRKCDPKQFAALKHLLLGAEKVKDELTKEIKNRLGIDSLEGYGCTELSPVVAVNVVGQLTLRDGRAIPGAKLGTVGRPLPATEIKTIDPETGKDLPRGATGEVLVRGPQVMVGYLNRPDATAKVMRDGWYCTGDIGSVDEDGFLRITDRISRFAKIGGEMVPMNGIEARIQEVVGQEEPCALVTALPDPKRGERLYVIHTDALGMSPDEVQKRLQDTGMSKLWIPSARDFIRVETLPIVPGSALFKIDLRRLKEIAKEHTSV